jgi:hypothetical protein
VLGSLDETPMKQAGAWFIAAFLALPLTVLAHECGHLAAAATCGLAGLELHYSSMTYSLEPVFWSAYRRGGLAEAAAVVAPRKVVVSVAGGPLVTYLVTLAGVVAARRSAGRWGAAAAVAANSRAIPIVLGVAATAGRSVLRGTDEAQLAALTDVPESALVLLALASLVCSSWWLVRWTAKGQRLVVALATIAGVGAGVAAYLLAGPHVLP